MQPGGGLLHEVRFSANADVAGEFSAWLDTATAEVLERPEVLDTRVLREPDDASGRAVFICQVAIDADSGLDKLLAAGTIFDEASLARHFGDAVRFESRLLREDPLYEIPAGESPWCLNCGARLRGQYCGQCGQRAKGRLISLWELVADAFGDLFELDSRLWQTLIPLVARPGRLTHDYLEGRRARFMPPFRMYLVLSLVFFLVAFTDPREKLGILLEAPAEPAPAEVASTPEPAGEAAGNAATDGDDEPGPRIVFGADDDGEVHCDVTDSDLEDMPGFLERRLTPERVRHVCEQMQIDDGRSFVDGVINAIPTALILLLPIMAFVLKVLYPLSRRYYVEHLLFFVHFHAFFFLILTLQILFARAASWIGLPDTARVLVLVASSLYIPVYLFVAMRRVYGQGRFVTGLKYAVLTTSYLAGFTMTMLVVAVFVAFSL